MRYFLIALLALAPACSSIPGKPQKPPKFTITATGATYEYNKAEFDKIIAVLSEKVPLNAPVEVVIGPIEGPFLGLTTWEGDHYLIRIEVRQAPNALLDTLDHEWAHAMVWMACREDTHDAMWGIAYARVYRAILEARFPAGLPIPPSPSSEKPEDD